MRPDSSPPAAGCAHSVLVEDSSAAASQSPGGRALQRDAAKRPPTSSVRGRFAGWRAVLVFAAAALLAPAVARAAWQEIVGGPSPINHSPTGVARRPHVVDVGGTLWVAWDEYENGNYDVHVARLDDTGTAWIEVGSALDHTASDNAFRSSIASIGGVPRSKSVV